MSTKLPLHQAPETTKEPAPVVVPPNSYILELRNYQLRDQRVLVNATEELFREAASLRRETIRLQRMLEGKTRALASAARAAKEHRTGTYDRAYYKKRRDEKKARRAEAKARRKQKQAAKQAAAAVAATPKGGCCRKAEF